MTGRRNYRRGDSTTVSTVIRDRCGIRYVVLTSPCCGAHTWVDAARLAYDRKVSNRPVIMRCGRRYDYRKLPGHVGCDWPWTVTVTPADDGTTPDTVTWTA